MCCVPLFERFRTTNVLPGWVFCSGCLIYHIFLDTLASERAFVFAIFLAAACFGFLRLRFLELRQDFLIVGLNDLLQVPGGTV